LDEDLHANLFPLSLKCEALDCFNTLPHGSITSFGQLKITFCNHFQLLIAKKFTYGELLKIRQRGQLVEKFIKFWIEKANQIRIHDDMKIKAFLEALNLKYAIEYFDYCNFPLDAFL